jgi:hypothetical protein
MPWFYTFGIGEIYMNNILKTTLIVLGALVLAGGLFLGGMFFANLRGFGPWGMMQNYTLGENYGSENLPGPRMMGGYAGRDDRKRGYGPGMMHGYAGNTVNVSPLSVEDATKAAQSFLDNLKNADLTLSEVMVFDNNAYVVVEETSTGNGAFELLVDPVSKVAYPEMGPNMMWNLKYGSVTHTGMMAGRGSGMMGGGNGQNAAPADVSVDMPVTQTQAIKNAQAYLDNYVPGATAATDPVRFYGYYTLDFEKQGKVAGMLSVNGFNGDVFLHTWHGTFIEEAMVK